MKKSIKAKWVRALRSGKYKQGRKMLVQDTDCGKAYCCLGVLCDILPKPAKKGMSYFKKRKNGITLEFPSDNALRIAGLEEYHAGDLATLNDVDRESFMFLADYIEAKL